jgi:anti-sigma factor RsiW
MNCEQIRQHWQLFHDSEGDAELHHQINEHLAMCPECSRWYFQQSRLEEALVEKLRAGQPTKAMWERIRAQCGDEKLAPHRSWHFARRPLWLAAMVLVAVFGAVWFIVVGRGPETGASSDLASFSVALHDKLASGQEALKLYSQSPREVEDYVRTRVSFPVRCPPREDAGFQVVGGGVCEFERDPVAYVVGDVDGQRVSVFIMARESLANYPTQDDAIRRQGTYSERRAECDVVIGQLDRNLILVVGRVDSRRLTRVLKAYGSYPDHNTGAWGPTGSDDSPSIVMDRPDQRRKDAGNCLVRLFEFAIESPLSPDLPPPKHLATNAKESAAANWGRGRGWGVFHRGTLVRGSPPHPNPLPRIVATGPYPKSTDHWWQQFGGEGT